MTTKQEVLKQYGIEVLDGDHNNIFIKYNDLTIPYNTNNYLFFSTEYFIKDVFSLLNIDEPFLEKEKMLNEYGITVKVYNNQSILLKSNLYHYSKMFNKSLFHSLSKENLLSDVLKIFNIDIEKICMKKELSEIKKFEDKSKSLNERIEFLRKTFEKLGITKKWIGSQFFLYKNGKSLKYSFDDYIKKDKDILVADIVYKFNQISKKNYIDGLDTPTRELPIKKTDISIDVITERKINIKKLLTERGFYN